MRGSRVRSVVGWLLVGLAAVSSPPTSVAVGDAGVASAAADLDRLHREILGTAAEFRASELVFHHRNEDRLVACMAAGGATYRKPSFVSFYSWLTDADRGYRGYFTVFDPVAYDGDDVVRRVTAYRRLPPALLSGEVDAGGRVELFNTCNATTNGYVSWADIQYPDGAFALWDEFDRMLAGLAKHPAVRSAYRGYAPCMRARTGQPLPAARDDYLAHLIALPETTSGSGPTDGRFAAAVDRMRAGLAADADCRRQAYRVAMTLLARELPAWERANRDRIDAVRARWRARVAQAERVSD